METKVSLTAKIVISSSAYFHIAIKGEEGVGYLYKDLTTKKHRIVSKHSAVWNMLYYSPKMAYKALQEYANQRNYRLETVDDVRHIYTLTTS